MGYPLSMALQYRDINKLGEEIVKVRSLFEGAFPEEERPPFEMILEWNRDTFFAVYENDEFLGIAFLIIYKDLAYLFFFAVEEYLRQKGYGSLIIQDLKRHYSGYRLFLMAEEEGEQYPNNENRIRRFGFYERNGLQRSGIIITEFGVRYELLFANEKVSKQDFLDVMESLIGAENRKKYYADC